MEEKNREARILHEALVALYKQISPGFQDEQVNRGLEEWVFELRADKPVRVEELEEYFEENSERLEAVISSGDFGIMFQQPVSILINYYFDNNRSFLRKKWGESEEALKTVYHANNVSFGK